MMLFLRLGLQPTVIFNINQYMGFKIINRSAILSLKCQETTLHFPRAQGNNIKKDRMIENIENQ